MATKHGLSPKSPKSQSKVQFIDNVPGGVNVVFVIQVKTTIQQDFISYFFCNTACCGTNTEF